MMKLLFLIIIFLNKKLGDSNRIPFIFSLDSNQSIISPASKNVARKSLVDISSFIAKYRSNKYRNEAYDLLEKGEINKALSFLNKSYQETLSSDIKDTIIKIIFKLAKEKYKLLDPTILTDLMNNYIMDYSYLLQYGLEYHFSGEYKIAIEVYNSILASKLFFSQEKDYVSEIYFSKGVSENYFGNFIEAFNSFYSAVQHYPLNIRAGINLAALHHKYGQLNEAIKIYENLVNLMNQTDISWSQEFMIRQNYGTALLQSGYLIRSKLELETEIDHLKFYIQSECSYDDGTHIDRERDQECNKMKNSRQIVLHKLYTLQRTIMDWNHFESMIHELLVSTSSHALVSIENRINELNHHHHHHHHHRHLSEQERNTLGTPPVKDDTFSGPFLPFDTLSIEINPVEKMIIAFAYSFNFNQNKRCTELDLVRDEALIINNNSSSSTNNNIMTTKTTVSLRIGFLSFDINDHPTAHLIEGIFKVIESKRINKNKLFESLYTVIFSYGKNDASDYRKILQSSSDEFVDLVEKSHQDSIAIIRAYKLDIILDMQMYTLGHRAEILARCVSPIQINYLVYPGTSGSSFLDTIVVDKIVAPPEHAIFFTEKLLILPTSYQVSYYDRYLDLTEFNNLLRHNNWHDYKMQLRTAYGLPMDPNAIVFCNFNKLDKLEPQSFKVWMQILARVRNSYLWLLLPSQKKEKGKMVAENIKKYAFYFGIQQSRILFARRVSKSEHIIRHFAADLFLDNLVYGAHSTATDSLRGVLPILTLTGKDFPSRVATSLYDSMRVHYSSSSSSSSSDAKDLVFDHMVCYSWREFEDLAVSFFDLDHANSRLLPVIKRNLFKAIYKRYGIFDSDLAVTNFIRLLMAEKDSKKITTERLIADENLNDNLKSKNKEQELSSFDRVFELISREKSRGLHVFLTGNQL